MELFLSVIPIFLLILLGYVLKRLKIINETSLESFEKLNHFALFPIFVLFKTSGILSFNLYWITVFLIMIYVLVSATLLLVLWQKHFSNYSGVEFTSIFQGSIRFNTYVTIATAYFMFGSDGLDLAVVLAALMSFVTTMLSILVFYIWGKTHKTAYKAFYAEFAYNPLFICFVLGLLLQLFNIKLPYIIAAVAELAGLSAIPLGLIIIGASLKPRNLQNYMKIILFTSVVQFIWKPLLVTVVLVLISGIPPLVSGVMLMMFVSPTSTMSYILARDLEGSKDMMHSIITLQTFVSFIIIPLVGLIALQ